MQNFATYDYKWRVSQLSIKRIVYLSWIEVLDACSYLIFQNNLYFKNGKIMLHSTVEKNWNQLHKNFAHIFYKIK